MRPPEFTGGNACGRLTRPHPHAASMRPPEFTGGNVKDTAIVEKSMLASMRPPEFTGGNYMCYGKGKGRIAGFNEAAGIHRRKLLAPIFSILGAVTLQ